MDSASSWCSEPATRPNQITIGAAPEQSGEFPNRLLTASEVAQYVRCHEETVRRAYLRGVLKSQRFGVRGRRFDPRDVMDWKRRGLPTRVSSDYAKEQPSEGANM
jgi:excisionase family DNA binding protein